MTQDSRILSALRSGAETSAEVAGRLRIERPLVSVALCRLAQLGSIERAGVANCGALGRPYVRWRPSK